MENLTDFTKAQLVKRVLTLQPDADSAALSRRPNADLIRLIGTLSLPSGESEAEGFALTADEIVRIARALRFAAEADLSCSVSDGALLRGLAARLEAQG